MNPRVTVGDRQPRLSRRAAHSKRCSCNHKCQTFAALRANRHRQDHLHDTANARPVKTARAEEKAAARPSPRRHSGADAPTAPTYAASTSIKMQRRQRQSVRRRRCHEKGSTPTISQQRRGPAPKVKTTMLSRVMALDKTLVEAVQDPARASVVVRVEKMLCNALDAAEDGAAADGGERDLPTVEFEPQSAPLRVLGACFAGVAAAELLRSVVRVCGCQCTSWRCAST